MKKKSNFVSYSVKGFTLIELLVAIAVIALLMSLIAPSLRMARERVFRISCANNQRSIASAMVAYASDNKGNVMRCSSKNSNMPYAWEDSTLVQPMLPYLGSMDVANCPSVRLAEGAAAQLQTDTSNFHYGEWTSKLLWLPGLAEDLGNNSMSGPREWLEKPPSVAPARHMTSSRATKIIIADLNIVWQPMNENWGVQSNHTFQGRVEYNIFTSDVPRVIKGSNRTYVDTHVEWVQPKEMGRNNTPMTGNPFDARYSHALNALRPYYW